MLKLNVFFVNVYPSDKITSNQINVENISQINVENISQIYNNDTEKEEHINTRKPLKHDNETKCPNKNN